MGNHVAFWYNIIDIYYNSMLSKRVGISTDLKPRSFKVF